MPSSLPASTQKLRPVDMDLSRVQDNVANPLDKLLAFCNGLLNGSTAENLSIGTLKAASSIGAPLISASAGIVSPAGFKAIINGFYISNVAPSATNVIIKQVGVTQNMLWLAPFPGSVVGIGAAFADGSNLVAGQIAFDVHSTSGTLLTNAAVWSAAGTDHVSATFAKGALPFTAGQYLFVNYTTSAGFLPNGTKSVNLNLIVEMAA